MLLKLHIKFIQKGVEDLCNKVDTRYIGLELSNSSGPNQQTSGSHKQKIKRVSCPKRQETHPKTY